MPDEPRKSSINARCYCVDCHATYSIFEEDMKLLPTMKVGFRGNIIPKKVLYTWADWVEHLATHCPECRYSRPPRDCVRDLEKHATAYALQQAAQGTPLKGDNDE